MTRFIWREEIRNYWMRREQRIVIYIFLTVLIEGCLVYGIFKLSEGLDLSDKANMRYVTRQYLYYFAYNIGYLMAFPYGMEYGNILSGLIALAIGCIGMFVAIYLTGEFITSRGKKRRHGCVVPENDVVRTGTELYALPVVPFAGRFRLSTPTIISYLLTARYKRAYRKLSEAIRQICCD
jgi:hypothetical protein